MLALGLKTLVGQADDSVEVALFILFLEARLDAFAKEEPSGSTTAASAVRLKDTDDQGKEEVCGLTGLKVLRGSCSRCVLTTLPRPNGRIGKETIRGIGLRVAMYGGSVLSCAPKLGFSSAEQHVGPHNM